MLALVPPNAPQNSAMGGWQQAAEGCQVRTNSRVFAGEPPCVLCPGHCSKMVLTVLSGAFGAGVAVLFCLCTAPGNTWAWAASGTSSDI